MGGVGIGARCFFQLIFPHRMKNAFAFLKTQYWRRNSKYVVNRNSQIVICFAFVFAQKVASLPAPQHVLCFSSSTSRTLLCSCFHPLPRQPALAASILATAVTYRTRLAVLPWNTHCCPDSSSLPAGGEHRMERFGTGALCRWDSHSASSLAKPK